MLHRESGYCSIATMKGMGAGTKPRSFGPHSLGALPGSHWMDYCFDHQPSQEVTINQLSSPSASLQQHPGTRCAIGLSLAAALVAHRSLVPRSPLRPGIGFSDFLRPKLFRLTDGRTVRTGHSLGAPVPVAQHMLLGSQSSTEEWQSACLNVVDHA